MPEAGLSREQARQRAWMLYRDLQKIAERDQEQEVRGIALPVVEAVLQHCKEFAAGDPVVAPSTASFTADQIGSGENVRAVDAALVAGQLAIAIGPEKKASFVGGFA